MQPAKASTPPEHVPGAKAPYVPPFLAKAGIQAGEWMHTSKFTVRSFMRPDYTLDVRILGCLMNQCHGYSGDLGVLMKRGKLNSDPAIKVPLSPDAIRTTLNKAATDAYDESGTPKEARRPPVLRQNIRRTLAQMEDDGLIDRMRANGELLKLVNLSLGEALAKGLVTPVRDLAQAARKKLNRQLVIYLLAKPRAAKAYNAALVIKGDYLADGKTQSIQLVFDFFPELKAAPEEAAALAANPEARRIFATYEQECSEAKEHARQKAFRALRRLRKPAKAPVSDQQVKLFAPDFHAELCRRFQRAGKPVPTKRQAAELASLLHGREAEFLQSLTLEKLRRVQHPGVLPSLADEFLATPAPALPAPRPVLEACPRCANSGLVGVEWDKLPEAVRAVEAGSRYCDCNEGSLTHDLVEPERLRRAAGVGRAS